MHALHVYAIVTHLLQSLQVTVLGRQRRLQHLDRLALARDAQLGALQLALQHRDAALRAADRPRHLRLPRQHHRAIATLTAAPRSLLPAHPAASPAPPAALRLHACIALVQHRAVQPPMMPQGQLRCAAHQGDAPTAA